MQLLGKNFFGNGTQNDGGNGDAGLLDGVLKEKRLLHAAASGEDIPESAVELIKNAVEKRENIWYRRLWRIIVDNKKHLLIAASVLVIGVAVYFNWYLYRADNMTAGEDVVVDAQGKALDEALAQEGADGSDYFAVSQISRQRARDEAIEVLQQVIDGEASAEVVDDAKASMSKIALDIENEAQIETLVKSKGFENCVAVISGECASVIVKTDGLLENQVAQIQEIVYDTSGVLPVNLKIIEK